LTKPINQRLEQLLASNERARERGILLKLVVGFPKSTHTKETGFEGASRRADAKDGIESSRV